MKKNLLTSIFVLECVLCFRWQTLQTFIIGVKCRVAAVGRLVLHLPGVGFYFHFSVGMMEPMLASLKIEHFLSRS